MENALYGNAHLEVADQKTHESGSRMMGELRKGTFKKHELTNNAVSFTYKEAEYLSCFSRMLKTMNYSYVLECRGEEE